MHYQQVVTIYTCTALHTCLNVYVVIDMKYTSIDIFNVKEFLKVIPIH